MQSPKEFPLRNLSLKNWHPLVLGFFTSIKNYSAHSDQCGRGLRKSIVLFIVCVPFLFSSKKVSFNMNAHYCYFDGQGSELESVLLKSI